MAWKSPVDFGSFDIFVSLRSRGGVVQKNTRDSRPIAGVPSSFPWGKSFDSPHVYSVVTINEICRKGHSYNVTSS